MTTDTNGFYLETASIRGRLLISRATVDTVVPPQAPKLAQVPLSMDLLERIAWCESKGDLLAKNPHSSATGKYQFLKGSWEGYGKELWGSTYGHDIFSEKDQDDLAWYVLRRYGTSPWEASRNCWQ